MTQAEYLAMEHDWVQSINNLRALVGPKPEIIWTMSPYGCRIAVISGTEDVAIPALAIPAVYGFNYPMQDVPTGTAIVDREEQKMYTLTELETTPGNTDELDAFLAGFKIKEKAKGAQG